MAPPLVPLYDEGSIIRVDSNALADTDFVLEAPMPMPTWTDDDERVEPAAVFVHNGVAYILVQGLDNFPVCLPHSRGYLHAFDPVSLEPTPVFNGAASLELAACNPTSYAISDTGLLALTHSGVYRSFAAGINEDAVDDGGLELIDLGTGLSSGLIANETELGESRCVPYCLRRQ